MVFVTTINARGVWGVSPGCVSALGGLPARAFSPCGLARASSCDKLCLCENSILLY